MKDSQPEPIILAIESAVAGGSLSLVQSGVGLNGWIGEGGVSRAEDLLPNIAYLLETSGVAKSEITKLAVSTGPGSYTGIRIGIATALGLKNGLNIPCVGVPVTEAMHLVSIRGGKVVTAIPMGKNDVAYQEFEDEGTMSVLRLTTFEEFLVFARSNVESEIIAESSLNARLRESGVDESALASTGDNLAYYVGLAASKIAASENLEPLFVKAA